MDRYQARDIEDGMDPEIVLTDEWAGTVNNSDDIDILEQRMADEGQFDVEPESAVLKRLKFVNGKAKHEALADAIAEIERLEEEAETSDMVLIGLQRKLNEYTEMEPVGLEECPEYGDGGHQWSWLSGEDGDDVECDSCWKRATLIAPLTNPDQSDTHSICKEGDNVAQS